MYVHPHVNRCSIRTYGETGYICIRIGTAGVIMTAAATTTLPEMCIFTYTQYNTRVRAIKPLKTLIRLYIMRLVFPTLPAPRINAYVAAAAVVLKSFRKYFRFPSCVMRLYDYTLYLALATTSYYIKLSYTDVQCCRCGTRVRERNIYCRA